jgi:NADH:ubiquinone oxidoreductase subunit 3 (subunit A)
MCTLEKEKSNTKSVILIIVIILLLAVIGVLVWMVLHPKQEAVVEQQPVTEAQSDSDEIAYDTATVAVDEESLQKAVDEMMAKQGSMALEMKVNAYSKDGTNYECSIANSPRNSYDMYMIIYLDETQEELYRSGLIPVGKKIERFSTNRQLESGNHECTLTYVQVEDDHKTTHATLSVGLTLTIE